MFCLVAVLSCKYLISVSLGRCFLSPMRYDQGHNWEDSFRIGSSVLHGPGKEILYCVDQVFDNSLVSKTKLFLDYEGYY